MSYDVINSDVHREVSIAYGSSSSGNMVELYTIKKYFHSKIVILDISFSPVIHGCPTMSLSFHFKKHLSDYEQSLPFGEVHRARPKKSAKKRAPRGTLPESEALFYQSFPGRTSHHFFSLTFLASCDGLRR